MLPSLDDEVDDRSQDSGAPKRYGKHFVFSGLMNRVNIGNGH